MSNWRQNVKLNTLLDALHRMTPGCYKTKKKTSDLSEENKIKYGHINKVLYPGLLVGLL